MSFQILHTCRALVGSKETLLQRALTVFGFNFSVAVVVAVVCLTLSRHDSLFLITTNVVMQSSKNTMECRVIRSRMTQRSMKGSGPTDDTPLTDRLQHNAFGGAFSEPLRKRSHTVCTTNHPTHRTRQSKRLQNLKTSNVCRTQPPTKFNMVAKSFP